MSAKDDSGQFNPGAASRSVGRNGQGDIKRTFETAISRSERGLKRGLITRAQRDAIVRAIKRKQGPPQYTALGGLIYIHGNGGSSDWTWGCVALENEDIEELYQAIPVGTPVTIKP